MEKEKIKLMRDLINKIKLNNYLYYTLAKPILQDKEYDKLYDKLIELENELGIVYPDSPTQKVGSETLKELKKVKHSTPLKSLKKTKEIEVLKNFMKNKECVLMLKCDGLTNKLEFHNNKFIQASTRGDGEIGEDITLNAKNYKNIPLKIREKDITVVGEAVIFKDDFIEINKCLREEDKFANPRNLVSGSVRVLNPNVTRDRKVNFLGFGVLDNSKIKTKIEQLNWLESLGFTTAPYCLINQNNLKQKIKFIIDEAEEKGIPYDGMVISYNDLDYCKSLGDTAKYPKWAKAFKFEDEEEETTLLDIVYEPSRNGVLTPVAIFKPVELEGTIVKKATLHNITILNSLELGIGDKIKVYKANQIIPQIASNLTKSKSYKVIDKCPVCGGKTELRGDFLYCTNEDCDCRITKKLVHFASRNALNIKGLNEKTLEKLMNNNFITDYKSLYKLADLKLQISNIEKLGVKSVDNLLKEIEDSRNIDFYRFIYALGINNIGLETAKLIGKAIEPNELLNVTLHDIMSINGVGVVASEKFYNYIQDNKEMLQELLEEFNFNKNEELKESDSVDLKGKTFVITGSVHIFKNRNEIKDKIESLGGKVSGSVSKNTNYLINNEIDSSSIKNIKAKELNVPIISEEQFLNIIKQ